MLFTLKNVVGGPQIDPLAVDPTSSELLCVEEESIGTLVQWFKFQNLLTTPRHR